MTQSHRPAISRLPPEPNTIEGVLGLQAINPSAERRGLRCIAAAPQLKAATSMQNRARTAENLQKSSIDEWRYRGA